MLSSGKSILSPRRPVIYVQSSKSAECFKQEVNGECEATNKDHVLQGKLVPLTDFGKHQRMKMHGNCWTILWDPYSWSYLHFHSVIKYIVNLKVMMKNLKCANACDCFKSYDNGPCNLLSRRNVLSKQWSSLLRGNRKNNMWTYV